MTEETLTLSDSVNKHYLDKVMELADERPVEATEDIFDARGMKLIAKGAIISRVQEEKLILHKLQKPLETCIAAQGGVDIAVIVAEAKRLAEVIEPLSYILGANNGNGFSPLDILGKVQFGSAMSMMLTITERGGPAALTHSVMVSLLSICLANKLGLGEKDQSVVAVGGLLHDIGELYIEPKYMRPEKRLLPHEWRHVIVHPRIGQMLIQELENYPLAIAQAVGEHHERFDGAGYPGRVLGKNISVPGQILSVAEMIAGLLLEQDNPLERAELALKIIPNEHSFELVSAISNALQVSNHTPKLNVNPPDDVNERAKVLFDHISVVVETGHKMTELPRLNSSRSRDVLDQIVRQIDTIQRAFFSTGLDACEPDDVVQNKKILFEAIVATKEIQWRLRNVARDLAMRSAMLESEEAEAFRPLIAMLDAEPDEKSLIRKISGKSSEIEASDHPAQAEELAQPAPLVRTLLLVDDEPNVITSLVRLLRPQGFKLLTAPSAEAALDILDKNEVGVILSDHRMPGMTGVELLSRVKTMYPMTIRMILSGYADVGTVTDAIKLGAIYKFLTKPWDQTELSQVLLQAFELYEKNTTNS